MNNITCFKQFNKSRLLTKSVDRKSVINDCCNNVSTLHRFRDITTFTTAQIKGHGCFPIHICVNIRSVLPVLWMTSSDRNKRLGKTDGSTWAGRLFKVTHRGQQGFDTVSYMHYWNWLARGQHRNGGGVCCLRRLVWECRLTAVRESVHMLSTP